MTSKQILASLTDLLSQKDRMIARLIYEAKYLQIAAEEDSWSRVERSIERIKAEAKVVENQTGVKSEPGKCQVCNGKGRLRIGMQPVNGKYKVGPCAFCAGTGKEGN